jgi:hypothetical protein
MQKIVALGSSLLPLDLQITCLGMLSRNIRNGNQVDIVIARSKSESKIEDLIARSFSKIGTSRLHFIDDFDHSEVTQRNVDSLRSCIEPINPAYAIMPFYKSADMHLEVLGRSGLLACRWIENVLMYDNAASPDSRFQPGIFASLSPAEYDAKKNMIMDLKEDGNYKLIGDTLKKMDALHSLYAGRINDGRGILEAFQSHRLLLLSPAEEALAHGSDIGLQQIAGVENK